MIRLCPNCRTERPLTEFYCEGTRDGVTCHWDLSGVEISVLGAAPAPTRPPSAPTTPVCPNGHPVGVGDLICPVCEAPVADAIPPPSPAPPTEPTLDTEPTVVEGWRLNVRLPASSPVRERFVAVHENDGRQAVLTLYAEGSEPDPAVYEAMRKLPRDHVPEIVATGRWRDRAFEVTEELTGGNLSGLVVSPGDVNAVRQIVEQLGRALNAFSECGLAPPRSPAHRRPGPVSRTARPRHHGLRFGATFRVRPRHRLAAWKRRDTWLRRRSPAASPPPPTGGASECCSWSG